MYRLLAIDLDGTLLSPQKLITPRTYAALAQAVDAGMKLVIATGQTLNVLRAVCAGLTLHGPQIIYNGAIVADIATGTILQEQLVPQERILPTLALLQKTGFYRVYHTHQHVYVDQDTPNARNWYRPPVPPALEVADVVSIYPQPCIKLVGVGEESTLRAKRRELERLLADQLYVTQASRDLLEFHHPAVSKGNALKSLAQELNIASEEIVAFGDHHNDIGMLQFAGLGIAMGNAHDEVKTKADYVTLSNSEDGVAAALEKMVLPYLPTSSP
ncbi:MAG: HAD family phosphatase [Ktedonobacteraceae bacterium]|nr:HAD family phosphatase [Ktedonobacteraceae bacterium]